jgi:hypothetical protein
MPSFKKHFASKFWKSEALDRPVVLTIATADAEVVQEGEPKKLVLRFKEDHGATGLVINRTRGEAVADIAGTDDYLRWPGTQVQLQAGSTSFQGRRVPCVEVVLPADTAPF